MMSFRLNDRTRPSVSTNHPFGGPHVLTVEGMFATLPQNVPPKTLRALLTIAGGERIHQENGISDLDPFLKWYGVQPAELLIWS